MKRGMFIVAIYLLIIRQYQKNKEYSINEKYSYSSNIPEKSIPVRFINASISTSPPFSMKPFINKATIPDDYKVITKLWSYNMGFIVKP